MRIIADTVITSTNTDLIGEKLTHNDLIEILSSIGSKQPLQIDHDLSIPPAGYIDNFRIIEKSGEYYLIGDVHVNDQSLEAVASKTGMSYSMVSTLKKPQKPSVGVFLPFPHYNDDDLVSSIYSKDVEVGKWIKKSADTTTGLLITSFFAWTSAQVGVSLYKTSIEPTLLPVLRKMGDISESFFYDYHDRCMNKNGKIVYITFLKLKQEDFFVRNKIIENGINASEKLIESDLNCDYDEIIDVKLSRQEQGYQPLEIRYESGKILRSPFSI